MMRVGRVGTPAGSVVAMSGARRVVSPDQVVAGACRFFLRHGAVDMDGVAKDLAISRATLYRVVRSRDVLLGDVLWALAERLLLRARRERRCGGVDGVDGVLEVTRRFAGQLCVAAPFRAFLRSDPETAVRVLLHSDAVHRRAVRAQREILLEVPGPWSSAQLDQVAFLYVRIVESAIYAELLGGLPLDRDLTERAARAVLAQSR